MNIKTIQYPNQILCLVALIFAVPVFSFSMNKSQPTTTINYSGILSKKNQTYTLQTSASNGIIQNYTLRFNDSIIEKIIHRLSAGDFISAISNSLPTADKTLNITGLNYIGLNLLIGTWLGDDDACYSFQNFTSLSIFNKNSKGFCLQPAQLSQSTDARKLSYFVNPDDQGWLLLISDKSAQYVAELNIKNTKTIQLNLFDKQTGTILSQITLRR